MHILEYILELICDTLSIEQIKYLSEKYRKQLRALPLEQVEGWQGGKSIPGEDSASATETPRRETIGAGYAVTEEPWSMLNRGQGLGNHSSIRDEALYS